MGLSSSLQRSSINPLWPVLPAFSNHTLQIVTFVVTGVSTSKVVIVTVRSSALCSRNGCGRDRQSMRFHSYHPVDAKSGSAIANQLVVGLMTTQPWRSQADIPSNRSLRRVRTSCMCSSL